MKNNPNPDIERAVEETLQALDGIRQASPLPFFYSRLIARMERVDESLWLDLLSAPAYMRLGLASVVLLIMLNAYTVMRFSGISSMTSEDYPTLLSEYYDDAITPDNLESAINP